MGSRWVGFVAINAQCCRAWGLDAAVGFPAIVFLAWIFPVGPARWPRAWSSCQWGPDALPLQLPSLPSHGFHLLLGENCAELTGGLPERSIVSSERMLLEAL